MANNNETVADIGAMLRRFATGNELPTDDVPSFTSLADRIEAAYKREVAELRECLQLAVEMKCANCGLCIKGAEPCYPDWQIVHHEDCWMIMKWRKALEGAEDGK